jgi:hypothetical protein
VICFCGAPLWCGDIEFFFSLFFSLPGDAMAILSMKNIAPFVTAAAIIFICAVVLVEHETTAPTELASPPTP